MRRPHRVTQAGVVALTALVHATSGQCALASSTVGEHVFSPSGDQSGKSDTSAAFKVRAERAQRRREALGEIVTPSAMSIFSLIHDAAQAGSIELLAEAMEFNELPPDLGLNGPVFGGDTLDMVQQAVQTFAAGAPGGKTAVGSSDQPSAAANQQYFVRLRRLVDMWPRLETDGTSTLYVWEADRTISDPEQPSYRARPAGIGPSAPCLNIGPMACDRLEISAKGVWHVLIIGPQPAPRGLSDTETGTSE